MTSYSRPQPRGRQRRPAAGWFLNLILLGIGLVMFAPFYWVLVTSVLPPSGAFSLPPKWVPTGLTLANFGQVFELIPFGCLETATVAATAEEAAVLAPHRGCTAAAVSVRHP